MQTLQENVKGKDLPDEWRQKAKVLPDEVVTVTIQPSAEMLTKRLLEIAETVSAEAEQHGLTEERLNMLLNEDD